MTDAGQQIIDHLRSNTEERQQYQALIAGYIMEVFKENTEGLSIEDCAIKAAESMMFSFCGLKRDPMTKKVVDLDDDSHLIVSINNIKDD